MSGICPRCKKLCHSAEARLALDQNWHIECFTCAICNHTLDSVSLYECHVTGEIFCRQCYRRYYSTPGYGYGAILISDIPLEGNCGDCWNNGSEFLQEHEKIMDSKVSRKTVGTAKCNQELINYSPPPMEGSKKINCHCTCSYSSVLCNPEPGYTNIGGDINIPSRSGKRKPIIPAFSKKVYNLPSPPPPLRGFWENSSLTEKKRNLIQCSKPNSMPSHCNKPQNNRNSRESTFTESIKKSRERILKSTKVSSFTDSDEETEHEGNVETMVKRFSSTSILNHSQGNSGKSYESLKKDSLLSKPSQSKNKQTIAEISDGLMKLSFSGAVQPKNGQNEAEGEKQEKTKSFWESLSIFSRTNKVQKNYNNIKVGSVSFTEESLSEEDKISFAMAVEDKKLSRQETEEFIVTPEELKRLSEDYDKIERDHTNPANLEVKSSASEMNRSFEHMKSISRSKIQTSNSTGSIKLQNHRRIYCRGCGMEIDESDFRSIIKLNEEMSWHFKCFKCSKCQIQLNERNYFIQGKWLYCMTHYAEAIHAPKCEACNQYILESSYTLAKGKAWHKDHFRCSNCKVPIVDSKFVTLAHEQLVCFQCYEKYFSKVCQTCGKKIKPTDQFIFHKDFYWHAKEECLHCHTCGQNLVGREIVFFKDGIPYCSKYCATHRIN